MTHRREGRTGGADRPGSPTAEDFTPVDNATHCTGDEACERPRPSAIEAANSHTVRRFTVAVFVMHEHRLLLMFHRKLQRWLPPGGHIEPNETPDDAAVREVWEETGVRIELVGDTALPIDSPRQLVIPQGIQVEPIRPGVEHIDLVYFGRPVGDTAIHPNDEAEIIDWYDANQSAALPLTAEMRLWVRRVFATLQC